MRTARAVAAQPLLFAHDPHALRVIRGECVSCLFPEVVELSELCPRCHAESCRIAGRAVPQLVRAVR